MNGLLFFANEQKVPFTEEPKAAMACVSVATIPWWCVGRLFM